MSSSPPWIPQLTGDGSYTFFSEEFSETFHSREGARAEAFSKFAQATDLPGLAQQNSLKLLDVCYGLGYNTAAALEVIWAVNPTCQVQLYGLELDPSVPRAAIAPALIESWPAIVQTVLQQLALQHQCHIPTLQASLLIGDARQTIQQLRAAGLQADAIFFDPFSPRHCPQLWSVEFFQQVAACLAPQGRLATYSRSAAVRKAMLEVGLAIGSIPLDNTGQIFPHQWSQGTIAAWSEQSLPPLSKLEREHLHTRAAIPYRDPLLTDDAETIRQRQQQEQQQSGLESTSSWRRRWGIK
uniref:MnmC-like methyltransferase domain-containing protein n=1 Tax=Cyanothece sp. (strain PCC 7425 / ATCC 29141) TaxID=395961 RepID=B8HQW6_CYAP4